MKYPFERSSYRILYPERVRPELEVGGDTVLVVDVSENGLRYRAASATLPAVGAQITGRVHFKGSAQDVAVTGVVIRCQGGEVAVRLANPGLPRALLFAEQRYLGSRYPERIRTR